MRRTHLPSLFALAGGIAASLITASPAVGQVIVPGWGTPIFEENFDGAAIDQSIWQVADWPGNNNNESQYYHPNQVSVWGGALHLRADRDPNWTYGREFNSGLVRTWQEWSYGRVEVRARVPYGQGFWPAIWLLPRTAPWPAGGEIDIMEARGDLPWRVSSAVHWGWDQASHQYVSQAYESGANFQAGYHTYTVEWDIGTVGFFVDGVEHMRVYEPAVGIPGTPKSIVLNLAVGGDYSGYPDGSTPFPSNFDIDYVRVWQRPTPTPPPSSLIRDPGFEDGDGAMAEWPRYGNTIDNVLSDWGTPLDGQRSLKMFGQFNGQENYSGALQNHAIGGGEQLTVGAHALTRSEDSIAGTTNEALLKLEFYSVAGAPYGSPSFLGESAVVIADGNSPEDTWSYSELVATTPAGTVEARVTVQFKQPASNPGGSVFVDSVTLVAETVEFSESCNGDGGDQLGCSDCPCGNNAAPGTIGGCLNSTSNAGRMLASGGTSVSAGDLRIEASGMVPNSFAVLTSGGAVAPGNPANPCFGLNSGVQAMQLDGLRCAVQGTLRHGGRPVNGLGEVGTSGNGWGPPSGPPGGLASSSGFSVGVQRHFQIFYRELPGTSCGREQNTSQAVSVTFTP